MGSRLEQEGNEEWMRIGVNGLGISMRLMNYSKWGPKHTEIKG